MKNNCHLCNALNSEADFVFELNQKPEKETNFEIPLKTITGKFTNVKYVKYIITLMTCCQKTCMNQAIMKQLTKKYWIHTIELWPSIMKNLIIKIGLKE